METKGLVVKVKSTVSSISVRVAMDRELETEPHALTQGRAGWVLFDEIDLYRLLLASQINTNN